MVSRHCRCVNVYFLELDLFSPLLQRDDVPDEPPNAGAGHSSKSLKLAKVSNDKERKERANAKKMKKDHIRK